MTKKELLEKFDGKKVSRYNSFAVGADQIRKVLDRHFPNAYLERDDHFFVPNESIPNGTTLPKVGTNAPIVGNLGATYETFKEYNPIGTIVFRAKDYYFVPDGENKTLFGVDVKMKEVQLLNDGNTVRFPLSGEHYVEYTLV